MTLLGGLPSPVRINHPSLGEWKRPSRAGRILIKIYILGSVQWINWESWLATNETCYVGTPQSEPCGQGRISQYSAVVESPEQIQQAVRFAQDYNIRLAIRNTGHDFLGRSSAPDSLQIFTHRLKNITKVDDFVPENGNGSEGPAVTIGAGVQLAELYKTLDAMNVVVVAGFANTVGAAGGYIQGGGHSPLGTWAGMSADNALEFKVVTADVRVLLSM